jgi:hypothetical protein
MRSFDGGNDKALPVLTRSERRDLNDSISNDSAAFTYPAEQTGTKFPENSENNREVLEFSRDAGQFPCSDASSAPTI